MAMSNAEACRRWRSRHPGRHSEVRRRWYQKSRIKEILDSDLVMEEHDDTTFHALHGEFSMGIGCDPEAILLTGERYAAMYRFLKVLPVRTAKVLIDRFINEKPTSEIGKEFRITGSMVHALIQEVTKGYADEKKRIF